MVAWFLIPYTVEVAENEPPIRRIDLDSWPEIENWSEVEVMGGQAAVKVQAPSATLDSLEMNFTRFDIDQEIPDFDRDRLRQIGLDAGYTLEQVASVDAGITTYRQFLEALATYRTQLQVVGSGVNATLVPEGAVPAPKSLATVDMEV